MNLNKNCPEDKPSVSSTAAKAIWPVAIEVVFGTALLGWAMLSLPHELKGEILDHYTDMMRYLGEHYGAISFGPVVAKWIGWTIGIIVGALLLSAVNTAVAAMVGLLYMLARDREMPQPFAKLNSHGVPWLPLVVAVVLPMILVALSDDLDSLADMYAIGVVGAITVNLGSCCFNKRLGLNWRERGIMFFTFIVLFAVEVTIAKTKPAALFFAACVLSSGFALRWWSMARSGYETVILKREMAAMVKPESFADFRPNLNTGQSILVAARGITPVLRYALEEAQLRKGNLYVLYVKQLAVNLLGPLADQGRPRWQDDNHAAQIMYGMLEYGRDIGVGVVPVYAISESPASTIVDIAATLGVDMLMLGSPNRSGLAALLKGNIVHEVADKLPENIQLIIHG
jgi:nucleotide-binding universal stress UspA family protein